MQPTESTSLETLAPIELSRHKLSEGRSLLRIGGDVDLGAAPTLKLALAGLLTQDGCRDVILDLGRLTFLDSTGLAVLIGFRRRLDSSQRLVIVSPPVHVQRLFAMTGLNGAFEAFSSLEDALHYLDATGAGGSELPLSPDAALVFGLASTAVPFAGSHEDEARCWARILLPAGERALDSSQPGDQRDVGDARADQQQRLDRVLGYAAGLARQRHASVIRTGDLLRAVTFVYGAAFERAIHAGQISEAHEVGE